jgi:hypothetical protein
MIKSYYDDNHDLENSSSIIIDSSFITFISTSLNMSQSNVQFTISIDQNSESEIFSNSFKRDRDRFRKYFSSTAYLNFVFNTIDNPDSAFVLVFVSTSIFAFAVVFKFDSIVHIALSQFAAFRQKELFLNLQRLDKKKSTISSKKTLFNQSIKTTYHQMFAYSTFDS